MVSLSIPQPWNVFALIRKAYIHSSMTTPSTNMMMNPNAATLFSDVGTTTTTTQSQSKKDYNPTVDTSTKTFFMLILGKPGGGKGTISGKILRDFPIFQHLSTGDVLRTHVRQKTDLGVQAKQFMDSGSLVPDDLIIELVMNEANQALHSKKSLLLDGFPRNVAQAISLDKKVQVDMVINLDIPTETIVERIADRYVCMVQYGWYKQKKTKQKKNTKLMVSCFFFVFFL